MAADFPVKIITPMGEVLDTRATYLRAPAADGQVGVMARHAPMITELTIGAVRVTEGDGRQRWFAVTGGALRVTSEGAVIMVGAAEEATEIDVERARRALERARHRLQQRSSESIDVVRAELALARAYNRLRVAEQAQ